MKHINKILISLCTIAPLAGCVITVKGVNIPNTAENTGKPSVPNRVENTGKPSVPNTADNIGTSSIPNIADSTGTPSIPDKKPNMPDQVNNNNGSKPPPKPAPVSPKPAPPPKPNITLSLYNESAPYPEHFKKRHKRATVGNNNDKSIGSIMDLEGKNFTETTNGNKKRKYTITIDKKTGLIIRKDEKGKTLELTYLQDFSEYSALLKDGDVYAINYFDTFDKSKSDDYTRYNELPKGMATYIGHAIGSNSERQGRTKQPMQGTTQLNVDFGGKTVEGVIFIPSKAIIALEKTKINPGNFDRNFCKKNDCQIARYMGKARENNKEVGGYLGYFYGTGASETAGTVWYNNGMHGFVFGGKKTEQNKQRRINK